MFCRPQIEMVLKGYVFKKGPMKVTLSKLYQVGASPHQDWVTTCTEGGTLVECCLCCVVSPAFFPCPSEAPPLLSILHPSPSFTVYHLSPLSLGTREWRVGQGGAVLRPLHCGALRCEQLRTGRHRIGAQVIRRPAQTVSQSTLSHSI